MPKIIIDEEKCIGCGACVDACPQGVIEIVDGIAKAVKETECAGCKSCMDVCPTEAIDVQD